MLGNWRVDHKTVYLALASRIRLLVTEGRILAGTRLPAERPLAAALGVSRTTIVAAYGSLKDAGFLLSAQGSGSIVTPGPRTAEQGAVARSIDFSQASPAALGDLPARSLAAAARLPGVIGDAAFDIVGLRSLRDGLAERYTSRGLPTGADQIVITLGAQHAIALIARALLARGDRALIEAPTYPHAAEAIEAAGGRLVTIPVTPDGWDVEQAVTTIERTMPKLGYLMPIFHNPTGACMGAEAREAILDATTRCGTVLIVDETTGEFAFDGSPVTPFAALATEDQRRRLITIGSVGKTIWGGIRVGWMRADPSLLRRVLAIRRPIDLGTPALEQLLVDEYLPDLDAIIRRRSREFAASAEHISELLARKLPSWRMPQPRGGIAAWIDLGEPRSSALTAAARSRGLTITSGPRFGIDGAFERRIRIPLTYSDAQVDDGIAILCEAWEAVQDAGMQRSQLIADSLV